MIIHDIDQRFPTKKEHANAPIDKEKISDEIAALNKISSTLQFSERYNNWIKIITKLALTDLYQSTEAAEYISNWKKLSQKDTQKFLKLNHHFIISNVKRMLGKNTDLAKHIREDRVFLYHESYQKNPDTNEARILRGIANIGSNIWPGSNGIHINTHPDSRFQNLACALDVIFHESVHIIEGQIGYAYRYSSPIVPDWLKQDAALIVERDSNNAYIPTRMGNSYYKQFNEVLAHQIGQFVNQTINLTPPAPL